MPIGQNLKDDIKSFSSSCVVKNNVSMQFHATKYFIKNGIRCEKIEIYRNLDSIASHFIHINRHFASSCPITCFYLKWTPSPLCRPEHWRQIQIPYETETHWGLSAPQSAQQLLPLCAFKSFRTRRVRGDAIGESASSKSARLSDIKFLTTACFSNNNVQRNMSCIINVTKRSKL